MLADIGKVSRQHELTSDVFKFSSKVSKVQSHVIRGPKGGTLIWLVVIHFTFLKKTFFKYERGGNYFVINTVE